MPKSYLHIGTHKTGSTLIQKAIRVNQRSLLKEGIASIGFVDQNLRKELMKAQSVDKVLISRARNALAQQLRQRLNNRTKTCIMSHEGFSGWPFEGYQNTSVVSESLRQITDGLLDATIVVYIRRQDDFVESLYTQKVQKGSSLSFKEFIESVPAKAFNWDQLLSSYAASFGRNNIIVRRYHKQYLPELDSLLRDFGDIVGSAVLKSCAVPEKANNGYSQSALEIARVMNKVLASDLDKMRLRCVLQASCAKEPFGRYSFWNGEERRRFLARFAESNAAVNQKYFQESDALLFPAPDKDGEAVDGVLPLESAIVVLVQTMLHQQRLVNETRRCAAFRLEQRVRELAQFAGIKRVIRRLLSR